MKYDVKNLDTKKAWIIGYKLTSENNFYTMLVTDEKRKQIIWGKVMDEPLQDYYIQEIELPFKVCEQPKQVYKDNNGDVISKEHYDLLHLSVDEYDKLYKF